MAAGGATMRLQTALQEYIASMAGDGGQMRSAQTGGDTVQLAEELLHRLKGSQPPQNTPGQRAAQRGGLGQGPPGGAAGLLAQLGGGRGAPAGV